MKIQINFNQVFFLTLFAFSSIWSRWFFECGGHDLWWQVQVLSQILNTLIGQVPVKVLPSESFGDVAARCQRLQSFDDVQIRYWNFRVIDWHEIFVSNNNTLGKQILVDSVSVFFGHQHFHGLYVRVCAKENLKYEKMRTH